MICDYGDVVVVPFPFVERDVVKRRPSVVLSSRIFNGENGSSVLAMITTGTGSHWPTDLKIIDGASAGLNHPSIIRWKLFTLPNELIDKVAGHLAPGDLANVTKAGRKLLFAMPRRLPPKTENPP